MPKKIFAILPWLILSYAPLGLAQDDIRDNTHEFQLDNGLQLIVREDHRTPMAVSQIWYKVGSSYETGGTTGVSHVLEHLMFKGTTQFPDDAYGKIVSSYGGTYNAFTSNDMTVYYQELPVDKLAMSFELEADRMRNLVLNQEDFTTEMEVIKEERRLRTEDQPASLLLERLKAAAYVSSPYHIPVIGWMDDLEHMTLTDAADWYQRWYSPNNAIIVVVGDVDPQAVYELAQQYFGDIPNSEIVPPKPQTEAPSLGQRRVTVERPAQLPQLYMGYNVSTLASSNDENDYEPVALDVIASILSGGRSSRLSQSLVREQEVAVSASAYYDPLERLDSLFILSGIPASDTDIDTLENAFAQEITRLQNELVPQEELDRVITRMKAQDVYSKDSVTDQALTIGSLESVGLPWELDTTYIDRVEALTPEQIQAVAQKYFVPERLTVANLDPQEITSPSTLQPQEATSPSALEIEIND